VLLAAAVACCLCCCSLAQFAFQSLFGIGRTQSFRLCGDLGLNPYQKLDAIPESDFEIIKHKIESTFEPQHAVSKRMGEHISARTMILTHTLTPARMHAVR